MADTAAATNFMCSYYQVRYLSVMCVFNGCLSFAKYVAYTVSISSSYRILIILIGVTRVYKQIKLQVNFS